MQLLTVHWDYDQTRASNGTSRYQAYLEQSAALTDAYQAWRTDPTVDALTRWHTIAWRTAQPPVMAPGLITHHPLLSTPVEITYEPDHHTVVAHTTLIAAHWTIPNLPAWTATTRFGGTTSWHLPDRPGYAAATLEVCLPLTWTPHDCIPEHATDLHAAHTLIDTVTAHCNTAFAPLLTHLD